MKKIIFILLIFTNQLFSQSTNIRLYSSDSMNINFVYKTNKNSLGYNNFYFQIFGYNQIPLIDYRNGMIYKISGNSIIPNSHNNILRNNYDLIMGIHFGYATGLKQSSQDTNIILYTRQLAWWEPSQIIYLTTNNGLNYNSLAGSSMTDPVQGIDIYKNNDSLMMYVFNKNIYKSTNRGNNWIKIDSSGLFSWISQNKFLSINNFNPQFVYGNGNNNLLISSNSGTNFSISLNNIGQIKSFEYDESSQSIYLLANKLYKTTNNGLNWNIINESPLNTIELDPTNPQTIWAGNSTGLLRSTNGGINFALYNNGFLPSQNVVGIMKNSNMGDTLIVATSKGVYKVSRSEVFTINPETSKFFPLHLGNRWVYKLRVLPAPDDSLEVKITDTATIGGRKFFKFTPNYFFWGFDWLTYDTLTSNILGIRSQLNCLNNNLYKIDSLSSSLFDTLKFCSEKSILNEIDTINTSYLGQNIETKSYNYLQNFITIDFRRTFYKNLGIGAFLAVEVDLMSYSLKGAVINGTLYGDTSLYKQMFSVSGIVRYSDNQSTVSGGLVKLLKYNRINGQVEIKDSSQIIGGVYNFNFVEPDSLLIVAYPNSQITPDFIPTFHMSAVDWHKANKIYPSSNLSNVDIHVHRIINSNNNVNISGKTYRISPTNNQSPLKDVLIAIKNNGNFTGFKYSDMNGIFNLNGMQMGNNILYAYKIGYSSDSITIPTTSGNSYENIVLKLRPEYTMNIAKEENTIPTVFELNQNYPNPFNPTTKINFDIPYSSSVSLNIYDVNGRLVKSLVNQVLTPGKYSVEWDASAYSSGIYFYKIVFDNSSSVKKMVLIK
ncbi:MAG TPA: T9SS type A sorting domain-containing protein [Ignavibacteria bacterium]|nr:T9SS type A sorting domain-containing protein [Ignavibacteria bacterium]